jgi:serine/threonine protein kinase
MGEILRAREIRTRRVVAMKVLLPGTDQSHARRWRFIEEAQITAQLEHPNIVPIHELGCDARQQLFYTMKLVKGVTLQEIVDRLSAGDAEYVERYPLAMLLTIFQKICDALAFAHSKGVIHRDLKPANIMVGRFGEVLVMDWGLVKAVATPGQSVDEEPAGGPISIIDSARRDDESAFSTMSGSVLGTPNYMAPEQARGENNQLSPRTDIFALGAILYHLITLRPPFVGGSGPAVLERIKSGEPPLTPREYSLGVTEQTKGARRVRGTLPVRRFLPHLAGGEVSDSLSAVSMKALAHDPGHRYQKVEELQSEIIAFQSGFATAAEKAGAWKQARLFVRRNRAALAEETLRFHHGEALPTTCADWEPHLHRIRGCHEEKDHAEVYAAFDTRFFALFQDNPAAFRERLFAYILEHESAFVAAAQT